jgi:putative heme-binding domain-containing protein
MAIVTSDEPPVRREAATALGRIGDAAAVPSLLSAMEGTESDRFLEHAVIFAMIRIAHQPATVKGLELAQPSAQRGALVALDQMDGGALTPEVVMPFLSAADPLVQQTALWVVAHHADWGRSMVDFFGKWLADPAMDEARRAELMRQLLAFAGDASVQELIGRTLADANAPPATRLLLLEVIARSGINRLPSAWIPGMQQSLAAADDTIASQAVAALRALPLDKRPLVRKIETNVDFPLTLEHFAGTKLTENFCVRWQGVIRCPVDGQYTFATESDDGSQLFIDDKLVVDNGGDHALREKRGQVTLPPGDHELRLEFVQGEGEAACRLLWAYGDRDLHIVPAEVLFHRETNSDQRQPGLAAEYFARGGAVETFPDPAAATFDELLTRLAGDSTRSSALRVQAAATVAPRWPNTDPALCDFLLASLDEANDPLVRMDAADALAAAPLDESQLKLLAAALTKAGVLEAPRLAPAFAKGASAAVGAAFVSALKSSPGFKGISPATLTSVLEYYPAEIRDSAAPLFEQFRVDHQQQQARLAELDGVLTGGDVQRGRELFFANQKAICATCHAVQGKGGAIGPDLSKIGAIRTPRDLLEAIVLPSASFARGYEPFNIVTDDGQVHSGIIAREAADALFLVGSNRLEVRVPRSAVETIGQSQISIMPEGMDRQLSHQELADLIEFLSTLR